MRVSTASDPRLEALFGGGTFSEASERPLVAVRRDRLPMWVIVAIAGVAAILLFWALESRRSVADRQTVSKTRDFPTDAPPPLILPPEYAESGPAPVPAISSQSSRPGPGALGPTPVAVQPFRPGTSRSMQYSPPPFPPANPLQGGAAMVIDSSGAPGPGSPTAAGIGSVGRGENPFEMGPSAPRVRATTLSNPSFTVPQGVLIPAVLETAFESTAAGYARAIVSRDVRGFDGTKVLIPRGTRLIGEYRGNVGPGQNRAVINWTRLIRGDGVTISLNSPAVDPLGGGGVRAKVNNHLFERFTDALLQSTVGLASDLVRPTRSVVLAVPGAAGASSDGAAGGGNAMRSLSVPAGTSISVFVAQDLEFQDQSGQP